MNKNADGSYVRRVPVFGPGVEASPLQSDIAPRSAYQPGPASLNTGQGGQLGDALYGAGTQARARQTWGASVVRVDGEPGHKLLRNVFGLAADGQPGNPGQ
jgi:hypothetical protein